MNYGSIANYTSNEGSATTTDTTITLPRNSLKLVIINDDATNDLKVKLATGGDTMTVKAGETISLENYSTKTVIVTAGTGTVPYRVWSFG